MLASLPDVRPPVDHIEAPPFPVRLPWINVAMLRMDKLRGQPVLVEFWDFCRVNSLRTLPYLQAWHERYGDRGLTVIGVHDAGFPCSEDPDAVKAAVQRLGITYPVVVDVEHEIWAFYGNAGWPGRYLWNGEHHLREVHYGEGAYDETELAIQELLGIDEPLTRPVRPEDAPGVLLPPQTADQEGAYSGAYEAGGVWAVLDGDGTVTANGREITVSNPGCYALIEHERHTHGDLELDVAAGVTCHLTCFTPGLAP
jgi:hypothetical protein